jgi:hypothetical protein
MLNIKEQIEEIADLVEMKFDIEKFFPFEERIYKLFDKVKENVDSYKAQKDCKRV